MTSEYNMAFQYSNNVVYQHFCLSGPQTLAKVLRHPKKKTSKKKYRNISMTKVLQANTKFVVGLQRFCERVQNIRKMQRIEIEFFTPI